MQKKYVWSKETGAMCMNIRIVFWLRMIILLLYFITADEYALFLADFFFDLHVVFLFECFVWSSLFAFDCHCFYIYLTCV